MKKKKHSITTVINYCTNDYRFLNKCIKEAQKFSHQILIPVCDHFFDGTKENKKLLKLSYAENPNCRFIEYGFTHHRTYSKYTPFTPDSIEARHLWHSTSRYLSYFFLKEETSYVLFIDADEIYEGEKFKQWLDQNIYQNYTALRIGGYIYFNSATIRCSIPQIFGLMVKKQSLKPDLLLTVGERYETFNLFPGKKKLIVLDESNAPMMHHYSWVRSKKEKFKKTKTWGHFQDKNWKKLIKNEEKIVALKKDPYYNCPLEKVEKSYFDPLKIKKPLFSKKLPSSFKNVSKTNYLDIFEKELKLRHNLSTTRP